MILETFLSPFTMSEVHLSFASMYASTLIFKILYIKEKIWLLRNKVAASQLLKNQCSAAMDKISLKKTATY